MKNETAYFLLLLAFVVTQFVTCLLALVEITQGHAVPACGYAIAAVASWLTREVLVFRHDARRCRELEMSGLYNALFGWNSACLLLAPMLTEENPQQHFPRFRDCYLSDDNEHIEIFTRVGGGNREDYADEIEKLRSMPTYVSDEDDDFDCTYATFTFGVPDEWRSDFEHVKAREFDKLSDAYFRRMQECYPSLDIRNMLAKPEGKEG